MLCHIFYSADRVSEFPTMSNPFLALEIVTLTLFLYPQKPIFPDSLDLTQETKI